MISKELMSEVLNLNITYIERCNNSIVYKISVYDREEEVNIYELAHKCKEWAFIRGYKIESKINEDSCQSHTIKRSYLCDEDWAICFCCETEPEAIFKACQWVLNNKDK